MQENNHQNDQIIITQAAADKVYKLIQAEDNDSLKLRVYIIGGGCSGFQYGFSFDKNQNDDDTVVTKKAKVDEENIDSAVSVVVDAMSIQYLIGAEIDYSEGLQGSRFIVKNPNATTTCGCGSSFSV